MGENRGEVVRVAGSSLVQTMFVCNSSTMGSN
jgi:hypothetical protein